MTDVKPATDYMVGSIQKAHRHCSTTECGDVLVLLARVDADREEIARLRVIEADAKSDDGVMGDGYRLRMVVGTQAQTIAALKAEVKRMRLTVCRACVPTAAEPQPSGADGNASPPEGHGKKDFQITCGTRAR